MIFHITKSILVINLINSTKVDSQKVKLYGDIAWELLPVDITKSQYYVEKELFIPCALSSESIGEIVL